MTTAKSAATLSDQGIWKTWAVICIVEASRMGVAPVASAQIHVLLYLANTLAQLFDVTRVRGRVLKKGPYPFYPDVQRELDRLALVGVLSIEKVDFGPRGHLVAHYGSGAMGEAIYRRVTFHSGEARRTSRLFQELISACFTKFLAHDGAIGPIDANYGSDDVLEGEVVDFSEWQDENRNIQVAHYLIEQLRTLRPQAERDGVRLYCDYIDRALAVHE